MADPAYESSPAQQAQRRMCEAVISTNSPLIGETIRDADFRATYGAAVVAVHRGGSRVEQKVGDIRLEPGDTLLLQTQPHFVRAHRNNPAFYLVSDVEQYRPPRQHRAWIALAAVRRAAGADDDRHGADRRCRHARGRRADRHRLHFARRCAAQRRLAGAGHHRRIVRHRHRACTNRAPPRRSPACCSTPRKSHGARSAALATLYFIGSVVMEVLTNNAAAVLMFPICLATAEQFDANPRPFVIALALAASASFMTPIGYQTNMMVYGPGGYRFSDFFRVGALLNVILGIVAIILIPIFWPFH